MQDRSIRIKGNITSSNLVSGDSTNSFNSSSQVVELEKLLGSLSKAVHDIKLSLPQEKAEALEEDLDRYTAETLKDKPSRKWYSLSAQGLIDAAKAVGEVGKPVLELIPLITKALGLNI